MDLARVFQGTGQNDLEMINLHQLEIFTRGTS